MTDNLLLWLDIETDGRMLKDNDPQLLEVAAVLTDWNFLPVGTPKQFLFKPKDGYLYTKIDSFVLEMHTKSGLIDDLKSIPRTDRVSHDEADTLLKYWIKRHTKDPVTLAGSGVSHFDSAWIKQFFPKTWTLLNGFNEEVKPTIDLGVIRRFLRHTGNDHLVAPDFNDNAHRALNDVQSFIEQAKWYRDKLRSQRTGSC